MSGVSSSNTACVVTLSTRYPPIHVRPRFPRRSRTTRSGTGDPAFDQSFVVAQDRTADVETLLPANAGQLLLSLTSTDKVGRPIRLDVTGDVLTLYTQSEVDHPEAIHVLADAAVALANSLDPEPSPKE
jgi:hypothetical protein